MACAVFLNAWNMSSREINLGNRDSSIFILWHRVDSVLDKCILHMITSAATAPVHFLVSLIQLVLEPLSWHDLIVQCWIKTLISERRKNSTMLDSVSYLLLSHELQLSSKSILSAISTVTVWLKDQNFQLNNEKFDVIISKICRKEGEMGSEKPTKMDDEDLEFSLDAEIVEVLKSWSSENILRDIFTGQEISVSQFLGICESKVRKLKELNAEHLRVS